MSNELDEFHGEAREILEKVAGDLVLLESAPDDVDLVNRIFRGAHSLKGLAGMLGFSGVSQHAHKLEHALDEVRMGRIDASPGTLDVLLDATEVLLRMVDALRDGQPDREAEAVAASVERLQGLSASTGAGKAAGAARTIDPEIAKVLSEFEEHRLSLALAQGLTPWRIDVSFPFETFDTDLPAVKERLKPYGEVITTMAGDLASADRMGFGLLMVSGKDPSVLAVAVAMPDAKVTPIAVLEPAAAAPPAKPPKPAASGSGGGAFEGFSANVNTWGVADLPDVGALGAATTQIDWNALAREGEPGGAGPAPAPAASPFGAAFGGFAPASADGGGLPVTATPGEGDTSESDRRTGSDRRDGPDRRAVGADRRTGDRRGSAEPAAAAGATTLRVNLERVDTLMNLVGELVNAKNAINQVAERMRAESGFKGVTLEIYKAKRSLERRLEELQKGIMQVRMLPLDSLFGKLSRVVRNLSRESGKEVELILEGAETEIDKVMLDELSDPLIHIVRNAVDHGLETTADRVAAGKPAKGTLRIAARPKGNHVTIEISDDGGGLDTDRIRRKAIEKGLLAPEATPSDEELWDMIFAPGFSTKEAVSEISGRGVGMDVVRNNIMKLNGIIDTFSEAGRGSRFTITLPLTLATVRALVVGVMGQTYAIPLASVMECVAVRTADLRTVEGREILPLRDSTLPLVRLDRFFGLDDGFRLPGEEGPARLQVVVVGLAQYRIGLVVDRLAGQQDVVVKSLGEPLTGIAGIMGATSLGDNRPVLVLDVAGVVNISVGAGASGRAEAGA